MCDNFLSCDLSIPYAPQDLLWQPSLFTAEIVIFNIVLSSHCHANPRMSVLRIDIFQKLYFKSTFSACCGDILDVL